MYRLIPLFLGLLIVSWAYSSDEPRTKEAKKPQYERMLRGDDAKKAEALNTKIDELEENDQFEEATKVGDELLALRRKMQGEDHWESINEKFYRDLLKKIASLSKEDRASWKKITSDNNQAKRLEEKGLYPEALKYRQVYQSWCVKLFGEEYLHTAAGYNNMALNLKKQGKGKEAQALHQKAFDIQRKILGEGHPHLAASYINLASGLSDQGKFKEALLLDQKALDIHRNVFGEENPNTAAGYNNVAFNLQAQGNSLEAQLLFQKALDIRRKILGEEHPETAMSYQNVAFNLYTRGEYGEAQSLFQKALDIQRKVLGEENPTTAGSYGNLAANLHAQGKYQEAQLFLEKSLATNRKILGEEHPDTARSFGNLASNLYDQGKYQEAQSLLEKSLELSRKIFGEEHPDTSTSYHNMASNLRDQGKYEEAQSHFQKCLDIQLKTFGEDNFDTVNIYSGMAHNLQSQSKLPEAQRLHQKALEICRKVFGEEHPDTALCYSNLVDNLYSQKKMDEAIHYARQAVQSYESARLKVASTGLERSNYGAKRSPYGMLAMLSALQQDSKEAFAAIEADLARGLLDEFRSQTPELGTAKEQQQRSQWMSRLQTIQSRLLFLVVRRNRSEAETKELDRIVEERKSIETQLAILAAKIAQREVASLTTIQQSLPSDTAILAWVDISNSGIEEHWGCILRSTGKPVFEPLISINKDKKWNEVDSRVSTRLKELLPYTPQVDEVQALRKLLHFQRFAPMEKHLQGIKHLYVVGVNEIAGIPIEVLTDKYTISYIPSGTFLARLKERPSAKSSRVLVLGDPFFPVKEKVKEVTLPPNGLLISQVVPHGNADKARIQANDVLLKYGDTELNSLDQFPKLIESKAQEKQIEVTIWREGKTLTRNVDPGRLGLVLDKTPAPEAVAAKRKADQLLASLRNDWGELPGTAIEITRLRSLFGDKTQILSREDATEQNLEELRKNDKLKEFRYLHFATHGQSNDVKAFESSLVLSPLNLSKESRVGEKFFNGELSAKEVLENWELDAELVTLSACESGLGRKGGGDGLLGFAQAFMKAGSRAVCLSLWKVDDCATALLMDRFYQNLLGKREGLTKPMPKAVALQEAKHWLKDLTLEEATQLSADISNGVARGKEKGIKLVIPKTEAKVENAQPIKPFEHPRYWAAFILIGDPN